MEPSSKNNTASEVDDYYNLVTFRYRNAELRHLFGLYVRRLTIDRIRLSVLFATQLFMLPILVQFKAIRGGHGMLGVAFAVAEIQGTFVLAFLVFMEWFSSRVEKPWRKRIKWISLYDLRYYLIRWYVLNGPTGVGLAVNVRLSTKCPPLATFLESQNCSSSKAPLVTAACIMASFLIVHQWTFPLEWGCCALTWFFGAVSHCISYWMLSVYAAEGVHVHGIYTAIVIHLATLLIQYVMFARTIRAFGAKQAEATENKAKFAMQAEQATKHERARFGYAQLSAANEELPRRGQGRTDYITRERPLFEDDD